MARNVNYVTCVFIFSPKEYLGIPTSVMDLDSFAVYIVSTRCLDYILCAS